MYRSYSRFITLGSSDESCKGYSIHEITVVFSVVTATQLQLEDVRHILAGLYHYNGRELKVVVAIPDTFKHQWVDETRAKVLRFDKRYVTVTPYSSHISQFDVYAM